ncbi:MAG: TM0106 family RecB-like putative nuclease [bacterium]|nr:TM0106 family RecB-like putative nuclease [bacterium]
MKNEDAIDAKLVFSPSLFFKNATCPHWIWHDINSDENEKIDESELRTKIREQGVIHEDEYVKGLDYESVAEEDSDRAFDHTLELMRAGAKLIYQAAIQYENDGILYRGRPDLLEKREGESNLGSYYYSPIDIKSSKDVKKEHKYQLILYSQILEQLQGRCPDEVAIIDKEHKRHDILLDNKDIAKAQSLIDAILATMKGSKPPLKLSSSCKDSPWFDKCISEAEEKDDIALIYNLDARAHAKLRELGIKTTQDMAKANIDDLPKIPYASPERLKKAKLQAQSLTDKKIRWLKDVDMPTSPLKIYFDIEGDPLLQIEYLFGFWVSGDPDKKYAQGGSVVFDDEKGKYFIYFLAEKPEDEKDMWQQFLDWLKILPKDYIVYHYAGYEKSKTNLLAKKYETSSNFEEFHARLFDLMKAVQSTVIFPIYFYSIKDIAKFLKFKWRHEKAGGGQSIFWYETWLEAGDKTILQDIINYNEDDVRATEFLHQWLTDKKI